MSKGITLDISRAMLVESSDYLPHNASHQRLRQAQLSEVRLHAIVMRNSGESKCPDFFTLS